MSIAVNIPPHLQPLTGGRPLVSVRGSANTLRQVVSDLEDIAPGMRPRLLDTTGELRGSVIIFVDNKDVRETAKGVEKKVKESIEMEDLPRPVSPLDVFVPPNAEIVIATRNTESD